MGKRKGFTLMELLAVLGIISLLAGIAIYGTKWSDDLGENTADEQTSAAIGTLIVQYKLHMGLYPPDLDSLTKQNAAGYGPYIKKIPKTSYGKDFNYAYSDTVFSVWSNGGNGQNDSGNGLSGILGDDIGVTGF